MKGESESGERQRPLDFFKHGIGLFSALGGFVGALATFIAVLSGVFGGGQSNSAGLLTPSTAQPAQMIYKEVDDSEGALGMSVPQGWAADLQKYAQAGSFGPQVFPRLPRSTNVGPALGAASHSALNQEWKVDSAFLGVSKEAAASLKLRRLSSASAELRLRELIRDNDWTKQGCEFVGESRYEQHGYIGYYRRWRDCGQVGTFYWELYATPADRSFVVVLQTQTQRVRALPALLHILRTFRVEPENLPNAEDRLVK